MMKKIIYALCYILLLGGAAACEKRCDCPVPEFEEVPELKFVLKVDDARVPYFSGKYDAYYILGTDTISVPMNEQRIPLHMGTETRVYDQVDLLTSEIEKQNIQKLIFVPKNIKESRGLEFTILFSRDTLRDEVVYNRALVCNNDTLLLYEDRYRNPKVFVIPGEWVHP